MPDLREKVLAFADSVDDMTTNRNFALAVAALVAEECARECENEARDWPGPTNADVRNMAKLCAAAIRAESKTLGADA